MIQKKTALITGITGQDGAYLAGFLLGRGYDVHGLVRWDCVDGTGRLKETGLIDWLRLYHGDICDAANVIALVKKVNPHEIYNLAALSHVHVSFETPTSAIDINLKGTLNILDAVRILDLQGTRIYQASSSEMFGRSKAPQNEDTPFAPCSPYGVAKLAAYGLTRVYREAYGMFVCNGILFNHESPLRGEDFVTQKIAKGVAAIEAGALDKIMLGNLDSRRDWGHARDYVEGMWMMLQQDVPGDYVLATGETRTVREFVEHAFAQTGVRISWQGSGVNETGRCAKTGRVLVGIDGALFRPLDVDFLQGDAAKARAMLGWHPKISFDAMVAEMVNVERQKFREGKTWKMAG